MSPATDGSDRDIVIRRTFAAPPSLVFDAWIDPGRIGQWWGPRGFSTSTQTMEVRPGGVWRYVMHGPDGTDFPNWIRYREVARPSRLVYDHGGRANELEVQFHVTVTFVAVAGGTELTMRSVFPTTEMRDAVVQRYGAIEGGNQTLARLAGHLDEVADSAGPERCRRRFIRRFAAPRALVFQAWNDPQLLVHWWGPHGFTNPVCRFDARVGGAIHIDMRGPDGSINPMVGEVREISAPDRLVFVAYPMDGQGRRLFEVVNTIEFTETGGWTTVTAETDARRISDMDIPREGMVVGWTQSFERLDDLLTEPAAARDPQRDIVTTRLIPAPREQVFDAWTDPAKLQRWWGPRGFRNTFETFDLRPGGDWRFVMHGPDGTDFPNHCVFASILPCEHIIIDHLATMHVFQIKATFYDWMGGTLVRFRMRFATAAEAAQIRSFVEPANEENMDRLAAVVTGTSEALP